ncbi:COG1590 domain protein [Aspergillus uvarum CBS 121591]|uniref:tRNA(Phe) 7-[(3-amino-3-carboxypropyl)-4-demethylwyosine(37)-N(4)]-methyltransferase n=1 Tax=Aspergillus uvarum CBS 121591 TaxID=1448315 RepID=A0A319C725_9EURO|nr:COG1590 domain protein [Aspergillus uvarum CBS 121591]PYH79840.1 COG1590 domain protein [Aspergillus uvarum CBS 121591]
MSGPESHPIPEAFELRKRRILAELSIPDAEYTDLSPKGSVDEGIRELIDDINTLPGLVTTSSCAGRISVFLEGRKKRHQPQPQQQQQQQSSEVQQRQFVPSGGKGAGKWLYVSHDALKEHGGKKGEAEDDADKEINMERPLHRLFGMIPGDGKPPKLDESGQAPRLVRFSYEPMILHIMAATLHHANPVLSAASSSGFRESGLQSLRCLDADDADGPSPIVAVRSAGMALESLIGYCEEKEIDDDGGESEPIIRSLVTEEYLEMLIAISNERFVINSERKERFRSSLVEMCSADHALGVKAKGKAKPVGWEDPAARRERMRAEGLRKKQQQQQQLEQKNRKEEGDGGNKNKENDTFIA